MYRNFSYRKSHIVRNKRREKVRKVEGGVVEGGAEGRHEGGEDVGYGKVWAGGS